MQRDIALAQVFSLREWADLWDKEAAADPIGTAGYSEVAMLMRRAATRAECAVGVGARPLPIDPPSLPGPTEVDEVREG